MQPHKRLPIINRVVAAADFRGKWTERHRRRRRCVSQFVTQYCCRRQVILFNTRLDERRDFRGGENRTTSNAAFRDIQQSAKAPGPLYSHHPRFPRRGSEQRGMGNREKGGK